MHNRLKLFDHLPEGHLAVPVNDFCSTPLIRPGDIAVIDLENPWLEDGGLYLRRFIRRDNTSHCSIWQARQRSMKFDGADTLCWQFEKHNKPKSFADLDGFMREFRFLPQSDGPYDLSRPGCEATRANIIGRVVGLISGLEGHAAHYGGIGPQISFGSVLSRSYS